MPTIRRFEEIEAWQTARELTRLVYSITEEGKFAKDFGLKDQIRRACVSIMSNIAEGFESRTVIKLAHHGGVDAVVHHPLVHQATKHRTRGGEEERRVAE